MNPSRHGLPLVLALCVAVVSIAVAGSRSPDSAPEPETDSDRSAFFENGQHTPATLLFRMNRLELRPDQRDDIRTILSVARESAAPLANLIREREVALTERLLADVIDRDGVRTELEATGVMRDEMNALWLDAYISAWERLDDDQRNSLREIAKEPTQLERRQPPDTDRSGRPRGPRPGDGIGRPGGFGGW